MIHVRIGDPPVDTGQYNGTTSYTCSCACSTCLSGGCCRTVETVQPISIPQWPWAKEGYPLVGYWTCPKCDTVVPPAVEHRCPPS